MQRRLTPARPRRACARASLRTCRARHVDPRYAPSVSDRHRARFARLVARALDELPAEFRERMRNIEIVVEDEPHPDKAGEHGLLGLYEGVPLVDRAHVEPYVPDRITIYRRPIERMASAPARQAKIVRDTVVHEVAHHFGITDERLEELGLGDAT